MRAVPRTLSLRLVLALTLVFVASRVGFGYIQHQRHEQILLRQVISGADELTRSVTGATWHAMLADDRDSSHRILDAIAEEPGIERIRIVDKQGAVTFSTREGDDVILPITDPVCAACHTGGTTVTDPELERRTRMIANESGDRVLEILTPIRNAPACSQASCHVHRPTQSVLGVLTIDIGLADVDREFRRLQQASIWLTLAEIFVLAVVVVVTTRWLVGIPIRQLIDSTHAIEHMDLDQHVRVAGRGEIRVLANSFNQMRLRLRDALNDLQELNSSLEQQVDQRSRELGAARQRLIQSDRLASLGQLAASVAHEINNPISGVLNFSVVIQRMVEDEQSCEEHLPEIRRYLEMMTHETERVGRIVTDLLAFSRRSSPADEDVDLRQVIERVMALLAHRLELGQVRAEVDVPPDIGMIAGDASQLQQVLVNLVMNAAEAMPAGGRVRVAVRKEADGVRLSVTDEGTGIDPAFVSRVFDPFFSTKEEGKGIGLGLSVVYGIVNAHGGDIEVESTPGQGSTFHVRLPRDAPQRASTRDSRPGAP